MVSEVVDDDDVVFVFIVFVCVCYVEFFEVLFDVVKVVECCFGFIDC